MESQRGIREDEDTADQQDEGEKDQIAGERDVLGDADRHQEIERRQNDEQPDDLEWISWWSSSINYYTIELFTKFMMPKNPKIISKIFDIFE